MHCDENYTKNNVFEFICIHFHHFTIMQNFYVYIFYDQKL